MNEELMNEELMNEFENMTPNEVENIPTNVIDAALIAVKDAVAEYDRKKKISNEAHHEAEKAKQEFMSLMKRIGKKQWRVDGFGGFSMYDELKFKVPKTPEDKDAFFAFLESPSVSDLLKMPSEDIKLAYMTVNSNTLNSLCKELKKLSAANGSDIQLPGIEAPKAETKIRSLK